MRNMVTVVVWETLQPWHSRWPWTRLSMSCTTFLPISQHSSTGRADDSPLLLSGCPI
jgi:hypothetical protein